jgi:hypothetical protein
VRAGPCTVGREGTAQSRTFRKHRRPCGQPAAVGELGRFRPVPPQTGHFERIKATPSDLPFKSTGFATYPVPPQFGQSSGFTPLSPLSVKKFLTDFRPKFAAAGFALRITNKKSIREYCVMYRVPEQPIRAERRRNVRLRGSFAAVLLRIYRQTSWD